MLTRADFVGPWAGLPVAWGGHGGVDEASYRADIARCGRSNVPGIYTGGTTGEFYAIELDEFSTITSISIDEAHLHAMPAMIGCTATSTRGALQRISIAGELGADAVQIALPFWLPVADHEIVPFFCELAAAAGPMAFSVYETERAKRVLTLDQHRQIHDHADNYLMVKANAGTLGATVDGCRQLSEFVNVFSSEGTWPELAQSSVAGACSATIYANPHLVLRLWGHLQRGELDRLRESADRMMTLYTFVFEEFAGRGFHDSAYDRLIGTATGFLSSGVEGRLPYSFPTAQDVDLLREWLTTNLPEMIWTGS